jgi:hypothetical protein
MKTKIIEATHGTEWGNWGRFMVGRFDSEHARQSVIKDGGRVLSRWGLESIFVMDLVTGEGAMFRPGGLAKADLEKHRVWVCPLFEPFLEWLYRQDLADLDALPDHVALPDAPFAIYGHRRQGPKGDEP